MPGSRFKRIAAVGILPLLLTACHADVTERVTLHDAEHADVSTKIVMDDQFEAVASQNGAKPFDVDTLRNDGWTVTKSIDDDGNHVIEMHRAVAAADLETVLGTTGVLAMGQKNAGSAGTTPPPHPVVSVERKDGLFFDDYTLHAYIPALMPATASNNPYAGLGGVMAASMISLHFVLAAPGKLENTDGELDPSGAIHWTINITQPREFNATLRTPDYVHIGIAVLTVVALIAGFFTNRRAKPSNEPRQAA